MSSERQDIDTYFRPTTLIQKHVVTYLSPAPTFTNTD